jgi:hypothetical protein
MALNKITLPDNHHPAYNPIIITVNDPDENWRPGFRYILNIKDENNTILSTKYMVPDPSTGYGEFNITQTISDLLSYDEPFASLPIDAENSYVNYKVEYGAQFTNSLKFSGMTDEVGFLRLDLETPYLQSQWDTQKVWIYIPDIQFGFEASVTQTENTFIKVSKPYSFIGASFPGWVALNNGQLISFIYSLPEDLFTAYNEAVSFKDFPTWNESLVIPQLNGYPADIANILTNSPNWLDNQIDANKYIIKTYQELYWNVFNNPNPLFFPDTTAANSMICVNEFGDRWMLSDYSNWDDADIKMRQFNVSPNNPEWINITPNWGLGTFYSSGINPYTHINSDGSLSVSKWLEFWPTYAPGYDDCDAINLEIFQDFAIPGPPSETFNFTFRPVVRGRNLRRIYHTLIDDKNAFLISEVDPGPQRVWNLYMQDNFSPYGTSNRYSVFAKRTSNSAPYGTTNASSNSADAWKAFDGNSLTFWETTDGLGTGTLTYNMPFDSAIGWARPVNYTINKGPSTTNAPRNWRFEASENGGTTWVTLHTVTNSFSSGTYTSPDLNISPAYTRFRIVVTATVLGFNVRINEFTVRAQSRIARMVSSNDCPTSGGVMFWAIQGGPIDEYSSLTLTTTAVLPTTYNGETDEFSTYPTLKPRRVYLDYKCGKSDTQILFLDRSGSWSSFAFPLKVNESITTDKTQYNTFIGGIVGDKWTYNTYDSAIKTINVDNKKQYSLTTDFLTEAMDKYFQELITSPVTYVYLDGDWFACNILDKALEPITRRLKQRTITIELSTQDTINI